MTTIMTCDQCGKVTDYGDSWRVRVPVRSSINAKDSNIERLMDRDFCSYECLTSYLAQAPS